MLYTFSTQWIFLFLIELSFIYLESSFNLKSTEDWTENQRTSKHLPIIISLSFSLSLFLSLSLSHTHTHTHTPRSFIWFPHPHIFFKDHICAALVRCTNLSKYSSFQNSLLHSLLSVKIHKFTQKPKRNSPIQLINYMK